MVKFTQSYGSARQFLAWNLEVGHWIRDQWPRTRSHFFHESAAEVSDGSSDSTTAGAAELVHWSAALGRPELAVSVAESVGTTALISFAATEVTIRDPIDLVLARCLFDRGGGSSRDRKRAADLVTGLLTPPSRPVARTTPAGSSCSFSYRYSNDLEGAAARARSVDGHPVRASKRSSPMP